MKKLLKAMVFAFLILLFGVNITVYGSDPLYNDQWYLHGKEDIIVALIDSGIDPNHEDLQGQIIGGWDFVDNDADFTDTCYGHGTSTAGILGAVRNNDVGISGAAEHVKFLVLRVLDCNGTSTEQRLVDAINYAKNNGANLIQAVILVSHAWNIPCYDQPNCLLNLCQSIENSGLLFVSPAGNESINLDTNYRYPPSCQMSNQIVVTASDRDDQLASFASYGQIVNLMAPGVDIWTTAQSNGKSLWTDPSGYKEVWGASYATPQVVALAAELLWLQPDMDVATLKSKVLAIVTNDVLSAFYVSTNPLPPPTCSELTLSSTGNGGAPTALPANSAGCNDGEYVQGEVIQLTASPDSGYQVASWSGTDNDGSTANTNTVTMPAVDRTVTVTYDLIPPGELFIDDFNRVNNDDVGAQWTEANLNFETQNNQLVMTSPRVYQPGQLLANGQTGTTDQVGKLQVVDASPSPFGFIFRAEANPGLHYEVHGKPGSSTQWVVELYDPLWVETLDSCVSAENLANGDYIGATVSGNDPVVFNMWRWDTDPGDDMAAWGAPDCTVALPSDVSLPIGNSIGVRVYAGASSNPAVRVADDLSLGDQEAFTAP